MVNQSQNLVRFEDSIPETKLVAMIQQELGNLAISQQIDLIESFDDLDYLVFAVLSLPSGDRVSLVRHQNSPQTGTEICVKCDRDNIAVILQETLTEMKLTLKDLTWIHPEYEQNLRELCKNFQLQKKTRGFNPINN